MTLGEHVRRLRIGKKLTQDQLATAVRKRGGDLSQPQLSAIEKDDVVRPGALLELAAELGTTPEALLGERRGLSEAAAAPLLPPAAGTVAIRPEAAGGRPDLPVWAAVEGGEDGAVILTSAPIDYIRRSERLIQVKDAFAFYVIGSSMSPAIDHGDQVVVHPTKPVRGGSDAVFIRELPDGTMVGLIKRLIRSTGDRWIVRQFEPEKQFELSKAKWPRAWLIVEKRYG